MARRRTWNSSLTNLQPQCQWWSEEVMEKEVCWAAKCHRMGGIWNGKTTLWKQLHPCPAHLPSFQGFSCSRRGFVGQPDEAGTKFEYIFPFTDAAGGCTFPGRCAIGTVRWLFHLHLAQVSFLQIWKNVRNPSSWQKIRKESPLLPFSLVPTSLV